MTSVWARSVAASLDESLSWLADAVRDCPDDRWRTSMWRVDPGDVPGDLTDEAAQRWSQPWSVAWHALEVLDYDLAAELDEWSPPPPFAGHPHWASFAEVEPWTREQVGAYVEHCRRRVRDTFAAMTDERAATPVPSSHRYAGRPYADLVTSLVAHTAAHATQVRQHVDLDDDATGVRLDS